MKINRTPVLCKRDFTERYLDGEFGNHSPSWRTPVEFLEYIEQEGLKTNHRQDPTLFHLRNARVVGGATYYSQTWEQAYERWLGQCEPAAWFVSQMIPPEVEKRLLIQGEVRQAQGSGRCGLDLYFTYAKKPMRDALKEGGRSVSGLAAAMTLKHWLCPNSHEWLMELMTLYEDHVVEFSTYSRKWGTLPGYNTIFWEVRLY